MYKVASLIAAAAVSVPQGAFAAPPIGRNRWRAPQLVAKWAGGRDATQYGHAPLGIAVAK